MGAASSASSGSVDDMLSATLMVGRAIAAIAFPGMYRIYDFHSKRAPKLKNATPFSLFSNEYDTDDEDHDDQLNIEVLDNMFYVEVGNDKIYLETPLEPNDAGWTPLHACCMSFLTVQAGTKLIEETVKRGGYLDTKTNIGPGTFNKGWTPLHMACAYGVEPLVNRLSEAGADVNTTNSYGYTPLLEACHRGFVNIVAKLLQHGARPDYIPPEDLSSSSPFVSTPAQAALAEAARCGFSRIVQELLDRGADKNLRNILGWTALHEACFYNRIETVKVLLLSGADSSIRTHSGALPFHLAGLQIIRDMLSDMGCKGTLPRNDKDTIDMMTVLQELTYSSSERKDMKENKEVGEDSHHLEDGSYSSAQKPPRSKAPKTPSTRSCKEEAAEVSSPQLLHSGPILGDLPMLQSTGGGGSPQKNPSSVSPEGKKKRKKKTPARELSMPKDVPKEFVCELCQRQMTEPVKTVYGNVFERSIIEEWLKKQGHICPLTGAPLSEADLTPMNDLKTRIRKWILQKSIQPADDPISGAEEAPSPVAPSKTGSAQKAKASASVGGSSRGGDDDLYDF